MTYSRSEPRSAAQVFDLIAERAPLVDQGRADIADDLAALRKAGLLAEVTAACMPGQDWPRGHELLTETGRANLSLGRLVEGHVNAARLIALYGDARQRRTYLDRDLLLAVWGADDAKNPAEMVQNGGRPVLGGGKSFCSGLGLAQAAIITAPAPCGRPQLLIIDATDGARHNLQGWQVSGMRATASGDISLQGMTAERLGHPGDQLIEPHFEGGIWRYLALHSGGLRALARECASLRASPNASDLQKAHLARLAIASGTASLWSRRAAQAAEQTPPDPRAVPIVLLAREAVEQACQAGIGHAERLIGTAAFRSGTRIDLIRRDLAFFLRQADLDGKLLRAAEAIFACSPDEESRA